LNADEFPIYACEQYPQLTFYSDEALTTETELPKFLSSDFNRQVETWTYDLVINNYADSELQYDWEAWATISDSSAISNSVKLSYSVGRCATPIAFETEPEEKVWYIGTEETMTLPATTQGDCTYDVEYSLFTVKFGDLSDGLPDGMVLGEDNVITWNSEDKDSFGDFTIRVVATKVGDFD